MSIYTLTDKCMFVWPLIAFTILCLLNTNTQQTLKKKPSALVLIRNGGCNPFSNIFFLMWGLMNQIQSTYCFFQFFKQRELIKENLVINVLSKCSKVRFSSVQMHFMTHGVSWVETNPSLYYNYSKSISWHKSRCMLYLK